MTFLRKVIVVTMFMFFMVFGIQNSYALSSTCSTTKRLNTKTQTYKTMYNYDKFKDAYLAKLSPAIKRETSVIGDPLWNNNFASNCTNGEFTLNEKNAWSAWRTSQRLQGAGVINANNNVSIDDAIKLQNYIIEQCGLDLGKDGQIGIKTINSVQLCVPPAGGKLGRNNFKSLTDSKVLFTDVKGTDLIYDSSKEVFSKNFKPDDMYIDVSKAQGIKDEATAIAKGLKVVIKDSDICETKFGSFYSQVQNDVKLEGVSCCYFGNKDGTTQGVTSPNSDQRLINGNNAIYTPNNVSQSVQVPLTNQNNITSITIPLCNSVNNVNSCRFSPPVAGSDDEKIYIEAKNKDGLIEGNCDTGCPPNHVEVMKGGSMLCEKCDMKKCNCGIKLNTNIPFIGRCIMNKQTNNVGQSGDVMTVNSLNAFPILMGALIKLLMSIIMIVCFASLIVGGFMMTVPDQYDTGKGIIKKVVWTIVALGSLGTILYLINPNFFA